MTPTVSLPSASLSSKQARTVHKAAAVRRNLQPSFPRYSRRRQNRCEAQIAVGINQLWRVKALGRMAPRHAHVTLLAARRLLHSPGLRTVLQSLLGIERNAKAKSNAAPSTSQMWCTTLTGSLPEEKNQAFFPGFFLCGPRAQNHRQGQ